MNKLKYKVSKEQAKSRESEVRNREDTDTNWQAKHDELTGNGETQRLLYTREG